MRIQVLSSSLTYSHPLIARNMVSKSVIRVRLHNNRNKKHININIKSKLYTFNFFSHFNVTNVFQLIFINFYFINGKIFFKSN